MKDEIIKKAQELCLKFILKVESGKAKSTETYQDCKDLINMIGEYKSQGLNVDKLSRGFDETSN